MFFKVYTMSPRSWNPAKSLEDDLKLDFNPEIQRKTSISTDL